MLHDIASSLEEINAMEYLSFTFIQSDVLYKDRTEGRSMSKFYTDVTLHRGKILLRGYDNGKRIQRKIDYKPYLFVPSKNNNGEYRSLFGQNLDKLEFDSVYEAKDFLKRYEDVSGFEIFGMTKFEYPFINDYYPGEVNFEPDRINVGFIDIEVKSDDGFPDIRKADKEITAITIKRRDLIIALGCGEYDAPDGVIYLKCPNEAALLLKFLEIWNKLDLDIISGWNIEFFDIPYLVNRITNIHGEEFAKKLSPWEILYENTIEILGRPTQVYLPKGICVLDYMQLYKKFTYVNQESYKLDHIAFVELGERKLDYSEYEGLNDLYQRDFPKFMDYNIHDTVLVERLDQKLNLISLAMTVAYDAKINFGDVFSPIRLWDIIIHNHLIDAKIAISKPKNNRKLDKFAGAYVKDPLIGMHNYVASFDVESLYPSLIVQYNISPETYRGKMSRYFTVDQYLDNCLYNTDIPQLLKDKNLALTANSCLWDRDFKGVFPQLVEKMMGDRKRYKNIMIEAKKEYEKNPSNELKNKIAKYDNLQMARKIALNSLYGALGNQYFRWFEIEFAEAITLSGQLAIRWTERNVNSFLNKAAGYRKDRVIAIDTDSVYLNLEDLVNKNEKNPVDYLDKIGNEVLDKKIKASFDSFAEYTNAYTPFLKMKREAIADKGIWTAKKRYILNVHDNEGIRYAEPKLKIMGIEAVKSSTPSSCREKIKQALKIVMNGTEQEVIKFINDFREEFKTLPFEDVAFPRGCNGLSDYRDKSTIYKKATPIHVRGALVYNNMLNERGLSNKYEPVKEGEKIKYCYLKLPNPLRENVISVVNTLPKSLDLDQYIDYNTQFNKAFLDPLKIILDAIGYQTEKKATLSSFFD
jgi:DNA polymerase elongation subunit (family B)